ncbi:MAG: TlpA disulfide reductase family protein [Thermoplasmata archaeon]
MNMKKLIILGITLGLILTSLISGCLDGEDGEDGEELEPAPDFTLTSIDGDAFSLSDYLGKVVVLDFMFVNCSGCIKEMEHLKDVFSNYDSNKVVIITIDILEDDTEDELRWFKDEYGDNWIYAIDLDNSVQNDYSISAVPVLVIVDKEGDIAYEHLGVSDYETLSSKIDKLL